MSDKPESSGPPPERIEGISFNDPVTPLVQDGPIVLAAARNETVSFGLRLRGLSLADPKSIPLLQLQPPQLENAHETIDASQYTTYQVLDMPVDLNQAGFVRHTGLEVSQRKLPRALLPVPPQKNEINLSILRDPTTPLSATARAISATGQTAPIVLWVDLAVPDRATAGKYYAVCRLMRNGKAVASIDIALTVYDFNIPDVRHLQMVGRLDWGSLVRQYPQWFETVTPYLMTRREPRYAQAIKVLDEAVKLAQAHRLDLVTTRLQPQVTWPANAPPQVSWEDFDSIISPWLKGEPFEDHIGLGYWPLPATDYLDRYDSKSRDEYWSAAASHFAQLDWISRCPLMMAKNAAGPIEAKDAIEFSLQAAEMLALHQQLRVGVPLEDAQLQFKTATDPNLIDPATLDRVCTAAQGLVHEAPAGSWPLGLPHPSHYLSTDVDKEGLVPYVGAGGSERDVRLWAWLAFLREGKFVAGQHRSTVVLWGDALPSHTDPKQSANPDELIWFYPGAWFGVDQPVPSIQLKWLRRAEQDYEYLYLARERGEVIRTLVAARLITKPVEVQLQPGVKQADPTYALMCGTSDPEAWVTAQKLLAQTILLRKPGQAADSAKEIDLNGQTLDWALPQEKPLLLGRSTDWGWSVNGPGPGSWIDLRLGLDIYNAADQRLIGALQWSQAPEGWQFNPKPRQIPPNESINVFNIRRYSMDAMVNLNNLTAESRKPIELTFVNPITDRTSLLRVMVPVANSDARLGLPLTIDGLLDDWNEADALQSGPLVRMFNGPGLQHQELQYADTPSFVYSSWGPNDFYVAFKLAGVTAADAGAHQNFVDYQFRRAWGEDLCEVLIQPIYVNNEKGPVLHLICKPRGQIIAESKLDSKLFANPYREVPGANVRYAARIADAGAWTGEIAIPWNLVNDAKHQGVQPGLLRFNFVQHKAATGESASWAGPIDFGRDDSLMGLLHVHTPVNAFPAPAPPAPTPTVTPGE